ncbi:MAG: aquaporin [Microbacteriaceae bacterium]|nr:aquaporin [Microbacteriaceae bacterium]
MASTASPSLSSKLIAELFGTFLLVFTVVGTAIFSSSNTGYLGIALAIGLSVVAGAYAFGRISGAHFNPAVTLGAAAAGRIPWRDVVPYIVAQIVGGIIASSLIYAIAAGGPTGYLATAVKGGFASTGYGTRSAGGFDLVSVMLIEFILSVAFLWVILSVTHHEATAGFAPLAIGLALTMVHLIAIPVSGSSVNPARSIASAIYGGPVSLSQLWVFLLVPALGGLVAGFSYKGLFDRKPRLVDNYMSEAKLGSEPVKA